MLNYNLPLTEAESEFAAEHHSVIYGYLRKAGLPEDDFYDVVVFGYLRAVRKYLARPELRKYSFSTIAYRAMSCDVHHSKEYWMRKKRRALVESLDVASTAWARVMAGPCVKSAVPAATPINLASA